MTKQKFNNKRILSSFFHTIKKRIEKINGRIIWRISENVFIATIGFEQTLFTATSPLGQVLTHRFLLRFYGTNKNEMNKQIILIDDNLKLFEEKNNNSTLLKMYFTIRFLQAVQVTEVPVHSLQLLAQG